MTEAVIAPPATSTGARTADVLAKAALVVLLVLALLDPDQGNLRDKGAVARAVAYPMVSFLVPLLWWTMWRDRVSFPWVPDVLITLTCFTDILGNRMDLYDTVAWFDDVMHLVNNGLLAAAVVLLTLPRDSGLGRTIERALAFGATAAIVWELSEYVAFLNNSSERTFAYADTLGDLALGTTGSVVAALVLHRLWRRDRLLDTPPAARVHA